jgi:two-component system response regulator YesN
MLSDRIIIVNHDRDFLKNSRLLFQEYEIIQFAQGKEFLSFWEKDRDINLVLLNAHLPDMDGLRVLRLLKEADPDIYVMMLSSRATKSMVVKALRLHADDFWEGPIDLGRLKKKIQSVLKDQGYNALRNSSKKDNVDRMKRFIQRNYKNATLDFISKELFLSAKYVSRMFNEQSGSSFRDYKIDVKITKAKELLKDTSLRVSEIALVLGYKKPESFMRIFKQITHKTPRQYRKEMKP